MAVMLIAINSALSFLARHAMTAMVGAVFLGLVAPSMATLLNPFLAPSVWLLLVVSLLRINPEDSAQHIRRPWRIGGLLIWSLAITPAAMFAFVGLFDLPTGIAGAMILAAGSSPLISTPALALLMGLDGAMVLLVMLTSTLLVPLTLPGVALVLLGLEMDLGAGELTARMAALVGSAVLTTLILRKVFGARPFRRIGDQLDGTVVFLLIVFAVAIMDGLTARLLAEPRFVFFVMALTFAAYIGLMVLTILMLAIIAPKWGKRVILSVGFAAGCRNLAVILAVLPAGVDPDMIMYFAVGQFPIYIMPAVMKPIMLRLVADAPISDGSPN
ncbi:MAG: hypothetical protein HOK25_05725 [Rhodospirillaceae bacterium]|nr:hypothetical protein [Rhodospirillaceae bacterium]MBT5297300.1 hypothetical protein [Rhodospirillaceae bacterium]MBT5513566.1 hypothetical protein [Rhodospirillaceae bacterium]MBT6087785.1 hypothetical protein [Rhodospirillaceae bacterium]MBT7248979.1 hypothetical protein [Rhodospirillaceae bacterium]